MKDFIAIDFETANPQRVSACALGYTKVSGGKIVESKGYLIKPIGGHASFQSKIHGIKEEHTFDKPEFGELYYEIGEIFSRPLVGYSLFDEQVLYALFTHFGINVDFIYTDSCTLAKKKLPSLKNHKLKTVSKHFKLQSFKHHDAADDSLACANIFLSLQDENMESVREYPLTEAHEFSGFANGILADGIVNYKEAYELLYWLEDHIDFAKIHQSFYLKIKGMLEDNSLDHIEAKEIRFLLTQVLKELS